MPQSAPNTKGVICSAVADGTRRYAGAAVRNRSSRNGGEDPRNGLSEKGREEARRSAQDFIAKHASAAGPKRCVAYPSSFPVSVTCD